MDLLSDLKWRGLLADCTDLTVLGERLAQGPITLYCGFDPTADSLHVGNLVPLFCLRRFQLAGHVPIALAGGATGMIGDPSGRSSERNLQTTDQLAHNLGRIRAQLARFLDFDAVANPARLVDNASWTAPVGFLEFLREVGKHFSVSMMVAKDSVRARLDSEAGISYTEFSYMLLQAFDFHHLRHHFGCELQIGATDQWGNITAGIELCRKKAGLTVWGLTHPLLTKSDGTKYGKSASGAVWLDPARTSPYRFYQFFIQSEDADVGRLLRFLTFLPAEQVEELERQQLANPAARPAQAALAQELTRLVHGEQACEDAVRAAQILFGGDLAGVTESTFAELVGEVPSKELDRTRLEGTGIALTEVLVHAGLCPSKGQARKDVEGGGIYVNNVREASAQRHLGSADLLFGKHVLLRKGKRTYTVVTAQPGP